MRKSWTNRIGEGGGCGRLLCRGQEEEQEEIAITAGKIGIRSGCMVQYTCRFVKRPSGDMLSARDRRLWRGVVGLTD